MNKKSNYNEITCCNECKNSLCFKSEFSNKTFCNWYCESNGCRHIIDMSVSCDKTIQIPNWCPKKELINSNNADTNKEENKTATKEVTNITINTVKPLTYVEKFRFANNFKRLEWDDLELNKVYHLPPVFYEKRKDIIITSKTETFMRYKVINKDSKKVMNTEYTVYKTNVWWKFLTEHKNIKCEIIKV